MSDKPGILETAHKGTLFLDEIGDLPAAAQAKLLRTLETRRVQRVGGLEERALDLRVLCATHRSLQEEMLAGRFRKDLYYRLRDAEIILPPLRDRRRELPLLARNLLTAACARVGRESMELSPAALHLLLAHSWPGNIRELRSVMNNVAATAGEGVLFP